MKQLKKDKITATIELSKSIGTIYLVLERKPENFRKFKAGENFNRRNTCSILRIKI